MADSDPHVVCKGLSYRYPAPSGSGASGPSVLEELDLIVEAGESVAVVGPSGCGKSTLLNLIGLLDTASSGELKIAGADPGKLNDQQRAAMRNEKIGFVFQDHHLLSQCTLLENILLPTLPHRRDPDAANRAKQLIERVGLADRMHHRPGELSGGQRQRTAVVRALINQPLLLLADEPTGALDEPTAADLVDLLIELNREMRTTLIMVTHATALAKKMATHYRLHAGKLESVDLSTP